MQQLRWPPPDSWLPFRLEGRGRDQGHVVRFEVARLARGRGTRSGIGDTRGPTFAALAFAHEADAFIH
eukprot:scaffold11438_cov129-Isochrysis_galbana.AAC.5